MQCIVAGCDHAYTESIQRIVADVSVIWEDSVNVTIHTSKACGTSSLRAGVRKTDSQCSLDYQLSMEMMGGVLYDG